METKCIFGSFDFKKYLGGERKMEDNVFLKKKKEIKNTKVTNDRIPDIACGEKDGVLRLP